MSSVIKELREKGVLEVPPVLNTGFISKMFLIKKPDGGVRPIFDLRGLNAYVATKHFQLISQTDVAESLQDNDWMVKIDLQQAYFHVPIAETHRRFLRVVYNQEVLQLTALPFGLSSAPRTFAALSNWIAELLRSRGIRLLVYLDDYLLVNQDRDTLVTQVAETLRVLESLGWHVNYQKSVLQPCQELEYLGILWNTQSKTMALPIKKQLRIKQTVSGILRKKRTSLREMQRVLGLLNFANLTTPKGRLHCRRMQMFLRSYSQGHPRVKRELPEIVLQDLSWWERAIDHSVVPLYKKEVTHFLVTDAADAGWGAYLNGKYLSGRWSQKQRHWHSNLKEMFAVYATVKQQQSHLRHAHILVQSDNRTLVAHIRKEGGTRSIALLELTMRVLEMIERLNITLSAAYLPGRYNGIADRLSRNRPVPEWHLLPQASEAIFQRWGVPDIDLFASQKTAVVSRYVTWDSGDGSAVFYDAFSRPWQFKLAWVFPPPSLMPRVLRHLNTAQGTYIVVAPRWTQCFWLTDLQSRALVNPIQIEDLQNNLIDLTTGQNPPQIEKLELLAWMVGGGRGR